MGYKLLGYAVWQGGKWYARQRWRRARPTVLPAGAAALLIAGLVLAQRHAEAQS